MVLTTCAVCLQYAMRLAFVESEIDSSEMSSWVSTGDDAAAEAHCDAMLELCDLRFLVRQDGTRLRWAGARLTEPTL